MNVLETLVTDRTPADVELWKYLKSLGWNRMSSDQQAQWSSGMKGAYNETDLNRVSEAVSYLAELFQSYGYAVSITPLSVTKGTAFTPQQAQTYLDNIRALMGVISLAQSTPDLPESILLMDYVGANNIEQILLAIYDAIRNMAASFLYSAQPLLYSGFAIYTASNRLKLYDILLRALNTSDGKALYVR